MNLSANVSAAIPHLVSGGLQGARGGNLPSLSVLRAVFFVLAIFLINQYKYKHRLHNNHKSSEDGFPHLIEGYIGITAQIP